MNNKLIYTVITNNYDTLKPIKKYKGFDFLVFTDNKDFAIEGWKTVVIPREDNPIKQQRLIKINSTKYTKGYDVTIYIDANIEVVRDPNDFLKKHFTGGFLTSEHPKRTSVKEECGEIVRKKKDTKLKLNETIDFANKNGFKDDMGLFETMVIIRDKSTEVEVLEKKWSYILENYSHRDQISLPIASFLTNVKVKTIPRTLTFKYMKRYRGHNVSVKFKNGGTSYVTFFSHFKRVVVSRFNEIFSK